MKKEGSLVGYSIGFILSLLMTLAAYYIVVGDVVSKHIAVVAIVALAIAQFFVQLFFFLHLGHDTKPRWKVAVLFFMIFVVLIVVFGSIWIMYHLDYNMMHDHVQMQKYLHQSEGSF